ncbi:SDR family NAD(P)-dependent oxidoreductase [Domibacillus mangrovi]|uniref:Oxidoreductase n=1 Tax=Domibacillus mangrovi TaxID=1714354 RepID=A0A1Q5P7H1_9BACI|nr:SDR family oxidoreductase [Domibacillus mangrovi]OKL38042.1 oxidoreductase [Domibacillus mangrovi]
MKQIVVITGASSGLGTELAKEAVSSGYSVVLIARRMERLQQLKQELETSSNTVRVYQADVTDRTALCALFTEIGHVDVLINNAGVGYFAWAHEMKQEETEQMMNVNVTGLINCSELVMPQMIKRKSGHIINISSQAGKLATPKSAVYAATKHAVLGYTNSIRMELGRSNVRVTAINPGPIATPFFDKADPEGTYLKNAKKFMLDPADVSKKTIAVIGRPVREVNMPKWMGMGSFIYSLFPGTVERMGRKAFFQK